MKRKYQKCETCPNRIYVNDRRFVDSVPKTCRKCWISVRKQRKINSLEAKMKRDTLRPKRVMIASAKRRAKVKGLPFDLTLDSFDLPTRCPVFGFEFGCGDKAASLDRIDPTKGYVTGNVIVVSWLANRIKTNAQIGQIRQVWEFYEKLNLVLPCAD